MRARRAWRPSQPRGSRTSRRPRRSGTPTCAARSTRPRRRWRRRPGHRGRGSVHTRGGRMIRSRRGSRPIRGWPPPRAARDPCAPQRDVMPMPNAPAEMEESQRPATASYAAVRGEPGLRSPSKAPRMAKTKKNAARNRAAESRLRARLSAVAGGNVEARTVSLASSMSAEGRACDRREPAVGVPSGPSRRTTLRVGHTAALRPVVLAAPTEGETDPRAPAHGDDGGEPGDASARAR